MTQSEDHQKRLDTATAVVRPQDQADKIKAPWATALCGPKQEQEGPGRRSDHIGNVFIFFIVFILTKVSKQDP